MSDPWSSIHAPGISALSAVQQAECKWRGKPVVWIYASAHCVSSRVLRDTTQLKALPLSLTKSHFCGKDNR